MSIQLLKFEYQKPNKELACRLNGAAKRAGLETGEEFVLATSVWGKRLYAQVGDMVLVPLLSTRRPPVRLLVAFPLIGADFFEPARRERDYAELAKRICLSSEEEAVAYHLSVHFDFGFVEKHSMPSRIASELEANNRGFSLDLPEQMCLSEKLKSLWWQSWGGALFCCGFTATEPRLVKELIWLRRGVGDFKPLPIFLIR